MNYTINHKIQTLVSNDGSILKQDTWQQKIKTSIKNGWSRCYMKNYDEVILSMVSQQEMKIFLEIRDATKTDFTCFFNQTHMARKLNCTRQSINRVVKKLLDMEYLKRKEGIFVANPFVFIPYNTPKDSIEKAQKEWGSV